ncbi:MAG: response regulator [Acidimicrobiia bacterium]
MAHILIADDAATIRLLVKRHLQAAGHEVTEAVDGPAALELGRSQGFDLAILDQLMPGMKGIDVLHTWRSEQIDLPVILLSGVDDHHAVVDSLEEGAADYIRKPFSPSELNARVGRVLATSG